MNRSRTTMPVRCNRCHRPLRDPESLKRGLGMVCFRKIGGKLRRRAKLSKLQGQDWEQMGLFEEEQQEDRESEKSGHVERVTKKGDNHGHHRKRHTQGISRKSI